MRDFERGYPAGRRPYDGGAADDSRGLEVVSGNAYSANQTKICRLPPPPGVRRRAVGGVFTSSTKSSSSGPAPLRPADKEAKRRQRVAGYNVFTVESKLKASIRKSLRWVKGLVHGS